MYKIISGGTAADYADNLLALQKKGGYKKYLVGGAVRDILLSKPPHDKDYVVFGGTPQKMLADGYKQVGKDFPVFLDKDGNEHALARKEIKTGDKHTEFEFYFAPDVSMAEDVQRRDFTCNALVYDESNQLVIDLVGGSDDIKHKILRHVNDEHFGEDPLRILRMCRFAAKLDFEVAPETMALAQKMVAAGMIDYLTPERVWKEFESALNTPNFDKFIRTMHQCGALAKILPDVEKMVTTLERTDKHPEGNTFEHTMLVIKEGKRLSPQVKFALLMHDVGKTLTPKELQPRHFNHDNIAEPLIDKVCNDLRVPNQYRHFAKLFAKNHMKFHNVNVMRRNTLVKFLEEISDKFKNKKQLTDFIFACRCDSFGRGGEVSENDVVQFTAATKRCLQNYRIQSKIHARDLPDFETLPKDAGLKARLWNFRISKVK